MTRLMVVAALVAAVVFTSFTVAFGQPQTENQEAPPVWVGPPPPVPGVQPVAADRPADGMPVGLAPPPPNWGVTPLTGCPPGVEVMKKGTLSPQGGGATYNTYNYTNPTTQQIVYRSGGTRYVRSITLAYGNDYIARQGVQYNLDNPLGGTPKSQAKVRVWLDENGYTTRGWVREELKKLPAPIVVQQAPPVAAPPVQTPAATEPEGGGKMLPWILFWLTLGVAVVVAAWFGGRALVNVVGGMRNPNHDVTIPVNPMAEGHWQLYDRITRGEAVRVHTPTTVLLAIEHRRQDEATARREEATARIEEIRMRALVARVQEATALAAVHQRLAHVEETEGGRRSGDVVQNVNVSLGGGDGRKEWRLVEVEEENPPRRRTAPTRDRQDEEAPRPKDNRRQPRKGPESEEDKNKREAAEAAKAADGGGK